MGTGDTPDRQVNPSRNSLSENEADTFKEWSDSYRKGNIVDLYLNKSGYDKDNQKAPEADSHSSQSWQQWFKSDDNSHTQEPVRFKSEEELKKEKTQEREIKTRLGVREEEAMALKAWLDWYEAGDSDSPGNSLPSTEMASTRADVQAREIKTRTGVREEEALSVKSWLEWYEAGDDPANQIPVEQSTKTNPDRLEKELRTRTGVQKEEAMAVKAWTDFYNAGDFMDAYLDKSGY